MLLNQLDTMNPQFLNSQMRRGDLAWTDWPSIQAFLKDELICRVAVHDAPYPYIVAQSFTFTGDTFLVHCSRFGTFAQKLRENPNVTIEVDRPVSLLKAPKGQNTSLEYYSVIARCTATIDHDTDAVIRHQNLALDKFRPEKDYSAIESAAADQIIAIRCVVVEMTAKKRILADGQYSPPGQPRASYLRYPFAAGATISGLSPDAFDPDRFARRDHDDP
ncbi:pyridoxamine 5'-phosphate oxidase family protein [Paraburkholderia sp. BL21I4N1]|uniref:pyridoxamine 5'-phosphate oxidase family protein n=1 Tax=Paraburkholderia sp. BL21I4N1 TaxID=1938801 RepID=UPI000D3FA967|nr:pyridoxamine 5'-phosphate oxidase family protein [Paraburkholderia sp. BL21I4N1]PQV54809.1 nitroimidazol reductase NimA-like FMN-containing flavoprotein (pyridoxamine 5'-phosphate oxidase superfamily) [Paraburkholderia sp. BL21I4N1]